MAEGHMCGPYSTHEWGGGGLGEYSCSYITAVRSKESMTMYSSKIKLFSQLDGQDGKVSHHPPCSKTS